MPARSASLGATTASKRPSGASATWSCARVPEGPVDDDDLPTGELERPRVDAREAELEHAAGPVSEQLEDPRRRGGGEGG